MNNTMGVNGLGLWPHALANSLINEHCNLNDLPSLLEPNEAFLELNGIPELAPLQQVIEEGDATDDDLVGIGALIAEAATIEAAQGVADVLDGIVQGDSNFGGSDPDYYWSFARLELIS